MASTRVAPPQVREHLESGTAHPWIYSQEWMVEFVLAIAGSFGIVYARFTVQIGIIECGSYDDDATSDDPPE